MQVIPSIDIDRGRSRVVFWPGASSGVGAPTDRPDRIAERFVELENLQRELYTRWGVKVELEERAEKVLAIYDECIELVPQALTEQRELLGTSWKSYSLSLAGVTYGNNVVGGFAWILSDTTKATTFYLDNILWE